MSDRDQGSEFSQEMRIALKLFGLIILAVIVTPLLFGE